MALCKITHTIVIPNTDEGNCTINFPPISSQESIRRFEVIRRV